MEGAEARQGGRASGRGVLVGGEAVGGPAHLAAARQRQDAGYNPARHANRMRAGKLGDGEPLGTNGGL